MSKKKKPAEKDDPTGPEQVEGGVQPANAKALTEEDHGSYADEVRRQNGLETPSDEMLAEHDDKHGGKGRHDDATEAAGRGVETFHGNLLEERRKRDTATPVHEEGAPVGVLAGHDAEFQRPDYLGLSRDTTDFAGHSLTSKAGPEDPPAAVVENAHAGTPPGPAPKPEDDLTKEHRGNQGVPGRPGVDDADQLRARIEEIAKKNLDSKRGEGEGADESRKNDEPERHRIEREWYEQQKAREAGRSRSFSSRRTLDIPNVGAVFAPMIGDTILVYLAAHCSFRRKPVPASVNLAATTDEQRASATNTVRVLEPLPAIVTHVDADGFQVEVFGARAKVHETFLYTYYGDLHGQWVWPEK